MAKEPLVTYIKRPAKDLKMETKDVMQIELTAPEIRLICRALRDLYEKHMERGGPVEAQAAWNLKERIKQQEHDQEIEQ